MIINSSSDSAYITPAQLCIGLHIHIDLPWTQHPFTFSNFKIKSLEQIVTLQLLGLVRIRYTPTKSDGKPLRVPSGLAPAPPPAPANEDNPLYQSKQARVTRLLEQQAKVALCERKFLSSARQVKSINQNVFSEPAQAREDAESLIEVIAESMLPNSDIAINLMKDKTGYEEVYFHSLNVMLLSMMLARELKESPESIRLLGMGAMFHDVGKRDIPDRIVRKTEALTQSEMSLLQQHCAYGVETGRKLDLPDEALMVIEQHHEFMDGSGYPKGLKGGDSLLARIVAIANTYDNLCNPIKLNQALTPHQALSLMYAQQRTKFAAIPMTAFVRCIGIYPPGTIVMLSNECIGMVVAVNSSKPLKPTVLIYDPEIPRERAILVELESEPEVSISRALTPEDLPQPVFDYLSPRRRIIYYLNAEPAQAST